MTGFVDADHEIRTLKALLRRSLDTIRLLKDTNDAAVGASSVVPPPAEPIAIIGMACELPGGVTTPEEFWSLLRSGRECSRDLPASAWVADVHSRYFDRRRRGRNPRAARHARANYLDSDVMRFDPRAFGISPKEARDMDPTQRLALRLTAEALERAGYRPRRVDGRVGVYFGVIGGEYGALARRSPEPGPYVATGSLNSVVAGRISHTFDFDGPAVAVDTACSSSLVALHLACEGIRAGDCDVAVVGGVNLLLDPSVFTALSDIGALSADGRCRPFAANGEGYGRGEGGGVVVLKRWSDARRDRDDVVALVRATAVNHDGACSGLTVPNGAAQRALIEQALQRAGLRAGEVDYLEAHGTGTRLGDPIEMVAASAVYCRDRSADRPLIVGSAKAQIGHLEAASGIASLIKVALVLRHRRVPAQLVAGEPNDTIDVERLRLRPAGVETRLTAPQPVGAVSSFGFSGTNGHAILSAVPQPEVPQPGVPQPDFTQPDFAQPEVPRAGRPPGAQPVLLSARSATGLTDQMRRLAEHLSAVDADIADVGFTLAVGREHGPFRAHLMAETRDHAVRTLQARLATPHTVTSSRLSRTGAATIGFFLGATDGGGQARRCHRLFSAFRAGFDRIDAAWCELGAPALARWIESDTDPDDPAELAALQLGLLCGTVRMWDAFGIRPTVWMAEGIGCFAVAVETAARTPHEALAELRGWPGGARAHGRGHPDPSRHAPDLDAAVVCPRDGDLVGPRHLADPGYWAAAATASTDITAAGRRCAEHGVQIAMVLCGGPAGARAQRLLAADLTVVDSGDPVDDPRQVVVRCLLRLYELGVDVEWGPLYENTAVRRTSLPTSSLDEAVHAFDAGVGQQPDAAPAGGENTPRDPLEPVLHLSPRDGLDVDFELDPDELALADTHHVVHIGHIVEMLFRGLAVVAPGRSFHVREMLFSTALVVPDAPRRVRLVLDGMGGARPSFAVHSLVDAAGNRWQQHVHGTLDERSPVGSPVEEPARSRPPGAARLCSGAEFYAAMAARGMHLGPSVRAVDEVFRDGDDLWAAVVAEHRGAPRHAAARVAPGLLDACAQLFQAALPAGEHSTAAFVVERLEGLTLHAGAPAPIAELHLGPVRVEAGKVEAGGVDAGKVEAGGVAAERARGGFALRDTAGRTVLSCTAATVRLLDAGIGSVLRAAGPVDAALRCTAADLDAVSRGDRTAVDRVVRRLLALLTGNPEDGIGSGDSTTALGVDSLSATSLHQALRPIDRGGRVGLGDLVGGITVAELTTRLLDGRAGGAADDGPAPAPTSPRPRGRYLPQRAPTAPTAPTAPSATGRTRLVCIPYGGGSTLLFQGWQGLLGDDVDVCPVALPGRGARLDEPLVPSVYDVVDGLEAELAQACDVPVVIYGHSAGALIGYLVALRLRRRGITAVRRLVVGAFSDPGAAENRFFRDCTQVLTGAGHPGLPSAEQIRALDAEALRELARLMLVPIPPDVDAEFLRLTLPILVNDIRMVGSFRPADAHVLDVPITAVHGTRDDRVTGQDMRDWRHRTSAGFEFHTLAGDHFFLHADQRRPELLDIIREVVQ